MDDRTAYEILKIRPGTSLIDINKRYENFVKIYKRHIMHECTEYSFEDLEQMKSAYLQLVYKRIDDSELIDLYPIENNSYWYKAYQYCAEISQPFLIRNKAKLIYTLIMSILTIIIIQIINYQPVDLRIVILSEPATSIFEYQLRCELACAFEGEMQYSIYVKKPNVEYNSLFYSDIYQQEKIDFYAEENVDVYVMEESVLYKINALARKNKKLKNIDEIQVNKHIKPKTADYIKIVINNETTLYKYICNFYNDNRNWVAVVPFEAKNKEQALRFINYIGNSMKIR